MFKHKDASKTFLQSLAYKFILFRCDFAYQIPLHPKAFANRLRDLRYDNSFWGSQDRRIIPNLKETPEGWEFELLAQRPSRGNAYGTNAKAVATIYTDIDGITHFEGSVTMASGLFWMFTLFVIIFPVVIFLQKPLPPNFSFDAWRNEFFIPYSILCGSLLTVYWIFIYRDRNHLLKLIENAVESSHEHSDKAKAS